VLAFFLESPMGANLDGFVALLSKARAGDSLSMQALLETYGIAAQDLLKHILAHRPRKKIGSSQLRQLASSVLEKLVRLDNRDTTVEKRG
jgi:hypothetical protein